MSIYSHYSENNPLSEHAGTGIYVELKMDYCFL